MKPVFSLGMMATLLFLAGCAEAQFGAHLAKQAQDTRSQGKYKVGNPYLIDGQEYYPQEMFEYSETGIASWYGPGFHGKQTANGEIYDQNELTAAHRTLQMPSLVRVTNLENGRSLVVRVNDRGPYARGRIIDLSSKAADLLGTKAKGTAKVRVDILGPESRQIAEHARQGIDTRGYEIALNNPANTTGKVLLANSVPQGTVETLPPVQVASVESVALDDGSQIPVVTAQRAPATYAPPVQGHMSQDGRFMPDPVVTQQPVTPTNIYVQAGAFGDEGNAMRLSQNLSAFGNASVHPANVGGRSFYRVRLGPYQTVDQADLALAQVVANGAPKAAIVVD